MTRSGWYAGWNIIAVAVLFQAVSIGTVYYGFTFWIEPWMTEFQASRGEIMLAITGLTIMVGLLSPVVGRAVDRCSIRVLVCIGAALLATGFLLIAVARSIWHIVFVYATLIAGGIILTGPLASQSLAVKWFQRRRGLASGLVVTGIPAGGLLMPHLITALFAAYGWRTAHLILGGLMVALIAMPVWFIVRSTPREAGVEPELDVQPHASATSVVTSVREQEQQVRWSTSEILSGRAFWVLGIVLLILNVVVAAVLQNAAPRAADLGFTTQQASFMVSALAGALMVGNVVFGSLADRRDARHLYGIAATIAGLSLYLMIGTPGYSTMLMLFALLGFAEGCLLPVLSMGVSQSFGRDAFGQVAGLLLFIIQGFGMLGAMLMGWIRDRSGSYDLALTVGAGAIIVAAMMMIWLLPRDAGRPEGLLLQQQDQSAS